MGQCLSSLGFYLLVLTLREGLAGIRPKTPAEGCMERTRRRAGDVRQRQVVERRLCQRVRAQFSRLEYAGVPLYKAPTRQTSLLTLPIAVLCGHPPKSITPLLCSI